MATGAGPPLDYFGSERHMDSEVFRDPTQDVAGHMQVVADVDALAGADLELELAGGGLQISAEDLHARKHASLVVRLRNGTAEGDARSHSTVVVLVVDGEALSRPAEESQAELALFQAK